MKTALPVIFVINPGSTSTKLALFKGTKALFDVDLRHSRKELEGFGAIIDQADFRRSAALRLLEDKGISPADIDVFIGRGGLLRPIPGGVFRVNRRMLADLRGAKYGQHASNLGGILVDELARPQGKNAYIAHPVVVDELSDVARISGHPALPRRSVFHALSHKSAAQKIAARLGKPYEKCNLIVAHIGGGVTVGVHRKGRIIDVNNGLDGEGPFSPERTGGLALLPFYQYACQKQLSQNEAAFLVTRHGGLLAHLGTNDCRKIEQKAAAGDSKHRLVYEAFIYQIAKAIGSMAAVLAGRVDAIVLTGGVARGAMFVRTLRPMVRFIAPVYVLRKNSEMEALARAARLVWEDIENIREY